MDSETIRERIKSAVETLPALSPSAMKIVELANDINASPRDLMKIIKVDPVLTGKILRLVNSAYFSLSNQITSLNRALIMVGFNTIKNIALSTAFIEATSGKPKSFDEFSLSDLWHHMLSVGVASKLMAKEAGQPKQSLEDFFIAGLLHDVGEMVLIKFAEKEYLEVFKKSQTEGLSLVETSERELGFNSFDVGTDVAKHWKLSDNLVEVISGKFHSGEKATYLAKVVHLADKYCRTNNLGFVCDQIDCEISSEDLETINLTESKMENISSHVREEIKKAEVFMSKDS